MMTIASAENSSVPSMPLNALPESAAVAQRTRDMDRQAAGVHLGDASDGVGGGPGATPALAAEVDRDDCLDRLAVGCRERPGDLPRDDVGDVRESAGVGGGLRLVGGGQAGQALIHHHGRVDIG